MSLNIFELLLKTITITFHDHKKVRLDLLKDRLRYVLKAGRNIAGNLLYFAISAVEEIHQRKTKMLEH